MIKRLFCYICCVLALTACAIENDIPYPIVDGSIQDFEVEGQCGPDGSGSQQATIDKNARTVKLYVDDSVNLSKLRITKLTVSNNATLVPDSILCHNYAKFPTVGFSSLDDIPISSDTRMDFSNSATIVLRTYQDYAWSISIEQVIKRDIVLETR